MPDIRTLVSSEIHEPKHISNTTSADAGKVITPLSGGESVLRNLTPEEVGVKFVYGEAALDANTTSFAIPAATDATLYTTSDYVQLNAVREPGVYLDHANGVTFNSTTNGLTVPIDGDYRIAFWMNVVSDTNNTKLGVKAKENGDWCNFTVKQDIVATGRVQNISGEIITDMVNGNEVTLWMASDKTADITIQDMRFYIELLRAT